MSKQKEKKNITNEIFTNGLCLRIEFRSTSDSSTFPEGFSAGWVEVLAPGGVLEVG
jgi:hypothetical protein